MNDKRPKVVIDSDIPFIRGRIEPFADTAYVPQFGFTPQLVADADAMVIRTRTRCNAELLAGSSVQIIATATIGMDQFDLPWCHSAGIKTVNAPACNAPGVAQYVWSCLIRHGIDPAHATIGIVGCGGVGSIVADWALRLGAKILVSDPPKAADGTLQYHDTPLDTLLQQSDVVTLHVPMTRTGQHPTYHLIGERELQMMRSGAWIVNAARGPVADNNALLDAIRTRGIHAIIDTWEGEPDINRDLLRVADTATYHIAGYSLEGKQRATRMALEALRCHFGWDIDTSGLAPAYSCPKGLNARAIADSFDPQPVMDQLLAHPEKFDTLRAEYKFRPEVK